MGSRAMDVTKPYEFIGFGDTHGPKPYEFIGIRWAFISQTPVVRARVPQVRNRSECSWLWQHERSLFIHMRLRALTTLVPLWTGEEGEWWW